jgi:hypothetical protein
MDHISPPLRLICEQGNIYFWSKSSAFFDYDIDRENMGQKRMTLDQKSEADHQPVVNGCLYRMDLRIAINSE